MIIDKWRVSGTLPPVDDARPRSGRNKSDFSLTQTNHNLPLKKQNCVRLVSTL